MLNKEIDFNGRLVSATQRPYVVAEIGSNFDQSLDQAKRLIDVAAKAGADAAKFQLFRAELMYPPGTEAYDVFKSIELNPEWVPELRAHAEDQKLAFAASPFDLQSLAVLEDAGAHFHKIASSEATNFPLLEAVAGTGKPMLLSTGMCDMIDVTEAVNICVANGNSDVILLQCAAEYPMPPEHANLAVLDVFRSQFGGLAGFSDHTLESAVPIAAVARGAVVIEKHITLDKQGAGPDHFYAMEPTQFSSLVKQLMDAWDSVGNGHKTLSIAERETGRREGLYAARDIAEGEIISAEDVEVKRPALSLRARYRDLVIGARASRTIKAGEALAWSDVRLGTATSVEQNN